MTVGYEQYLEDLETYHKSGGELYGFEGDSGITSLKGKRSKEVSVQTSENIAHASYQLIKKGTYAW